MTPDATCINKLTMIRQLNSCTAFNAMCSLYSLQIYCYKMHCYKYTDTALLRYQYHDVAADGVAFLPSTTTTVAAVGTCNMLSYHC
eukprot:7012-Heterococcus_DN1.PRE.2